MPLERFFSLDRSLELATGTAPVFFNLLNSDVIATASPTSRPIRFVIWASRVSALSVEFSNSFKYFNVSVSLLNAVFACSLNSVIGERDAAS